MKLYFLVVFQQIILYLIAIHIIEFLVNFGKKISKIELPCAFLISVDNQINNSCLFLMRLEMNL
jgi:hypothetical protein